MENQQKSEQSRERGSLVIIFALAAPIIFLLTFAAIDVAHAVYVQRHIQKVADMAAIAAAEGLQNAQTAAQQNAQANGFQQGLNSYLTVNTGYWSPNTPGQEHFTRYLHDHNPNAARVKVTEEVPYVAFLPPIKLTATAIGWAPSAAGIGIASTLLNLHSTTKASLLNGILGGLLGAKLNLSLLGYQGLANTNLSLGGLAQAVGVGTVNNLLDANLSLPELYQGALTVLGNRAGGGLLNGNSANAQGALASIIGATPTTGATVQLSKIITLGLTNAQAAASAQVNLLNLITASAMVSNGKHFVDVPGINVLGLASLKLAVISPPQLAFGDPGKNSQGQWRTTAKTAQVALQLNVLGSLVPVTLLVSPAVAHLQAVRCATPQNHSQVTISAGTSLLTGGIGILSSASFPSAVPVQNFSDVTFTGLPNQHRQIHSTGGNDQPVNIYVKILGIKLNLGNLLSRVINLLAPVLQILGISLGTADVQYTALSCGNAILVY